MHHIKTNYYHNLFKTEIIFNIILLRNNINIQLPNDIIQFIIKLYIDININTVDISCGKGHSIIKINKAIYYAGNMHILWPYNFISNVEPTAKPTHQPTNTGNRFQRIFLKYNLISMYCRKKHTFLLGKNHHTDKQNILYYYPVPIVVNPCPNKYIKFRNSCINNDNDSDNFIASDVISFSSGSGHILISTKKYGLFCSGKNKNGQLGLGDYNNRIDDYIRLPFENIILIKCGEINSMIMNNNNELFSCGWNFYGQLGLDHYDKTNEFTKINLNNNIIDFACGKSHSIVLTTNGLYYCGFKFFDDWKNNKSSSLFRMDIEDIISISCGYDFSLVLTKDGLFKTRNYDERVSRFNPWSIFEKLKINDIISFGCGDYHIIVLTKNGFFGYGRNNTGQLGIDDDNKYEENVNYFKKIEI